MDESRVAMFLDIENLLFPFRQLQLWDEGMGLLANLLEEVRATGIVVSAVGVCDLSAWRKVAFPLSSLGVRVFSHQGGVDAADRILAEHIQSGLSPSAGTVVIASGDHYFSGIASDLRAAGRHVIVAALRKSLSHDLYRAATEARLLPIPAAHAA